jgi:hypothetical protein
LTNDSISFVSSVYIRQPSVYSTMIMSFLMKRHGYDFDFLNPSLAYIAFNLRNQFLMLVPVRIGFILVLMPILRFCVQILLEIEDICLLLVLLVGTLV